MQCIRCEHKFTNDDLRLGLVRAIESVLFCIPCTTKILKEWLLKFNEVKDLG